MTGLPPPLRSENAAEQLLAALFSCSHCHKHALRESVPPVVTLAYLSGWAAGARHGAPTEPEPKGGEPHA